jgi:alpha-2-macroglobulin
VSNRGLALRLIIPACAALSILIGLCTGSDDADIPPAKEIEKADGLFEEKNYAEAASLYGRVSAGDSHHEKWAYACEQILICKLRLQLYDDAVAEAEKYVANCPDAVQEAKAARIAGNLYLNIPHWGTRAGGKFHRGQWSQGIRLSSTRHDRNNALAHFDRARSLYAACEDDPDSAGLETKEKRREFHEERIECLFDFVAACSRFGIYENEWRYWYSWWGERDDFLAETAGEDDFDEYYSSWEQKRKRPIGLRLSADGEPVFPAMPSSYSPDLADDEKTLYLLKEVRDLDNTENDRFAARSWFRQAMLARIRFGVERLQSYAGLYSYDGRQPLLEEFEKFNPWELADDEALVLAGGRIHKTTLPEEHDTFKLLRIVTGDCPKSGLADEALYSIALTSQTRQQYPSALSAYENLRRRFPKSEWADNAQTQIDRIKMAQVRISDSGVQVPGEPANLQVSYRNMGKIWFQARPIDLKGFLSEMRDRVIAENGKRSYEWTLGRWHAYFIDKGADSQWDQWIRELAAKHVGPVEARWADNVAENGTHRYAQATLQAAFKDPGAYLVTAFLAEPGADLEDRKGVSLFGQGGSRAVVVLTDLAIVDKRTGKGNLIYIADALTGAPVPGADLDVLEVWQTWSKKTRTVYHKRSTRLVTDGEGMAILSKRPDIHPRVHILATRGERLAWSGMSNMANYHPSSMRKGTYAFTITDRPVYRPEQAVKFKVWLRNVEKGVFQSPPTRSVTVEIHDPRGNTVFTSRNQPDRYGAIDGEFTLGEEPPLGVYWIRVKDAGISGGQTFRVEEYKKPEFEVTVEPGSSLARLGEKITAKIGAHYFFGAPVTDATVKYKVFREEYRHSYHFPGHWDWLYGTGYGFGWYSSEAFPWWSRVGCMARPAWWYGMYGGRARNPVRELVTQGETTIGADGTVEISIDTAPALRDHPDVDHRYVISAEVRDASRRVITGEGAVTVTRRAFYTFVQSDRGYCRPGEEMEIRIRCLTPDNRPVETEGMVTVSRVVFGGPDNAHLERSEIDRWKAKTDSRGILTFRVREERSGQLEIRFEAPDAWGGRVEGYGLVWVCGPDFDGRFHRFNDLELITDKRTYEPGDVCHMMINTKQANSYVLFSDNVDNGHLLSWRLLHLPGRHIVVDVPVTKDRRPNFFVEAATVSGARLHQQVKRICVPPEEGIVAIDVKTDRGEYEPGAKAQVTVSARDGEGKPVSAQLCLSAFDRSVLAIQSEYTPDIRKFFHGHVRSHYLTSTTNLTERFSAAGYVHRPFEHLDPAPDEWWMITHQPSGVWGDDLSLGILDELSQDLGEGGFLTGRGSKTRYGGRGKKESKEELGRAMKSKAGDGPGGPPTSTAGRDGEENAQGTRFAEAEVRSRFADTALWLTTVTTDDEGKATVEMEMPENLTTWKINAWAMTRETRVGHGTTEAVTTKNLLVRLQAPRFFLEYDEVVISANVHNELDEEKTARVSLDIPGGLLALIGDTPGELDVTVPAHQAHRVDWRVKVIREGSVAITVTALTDEESDAMKMTFPVLVHGMIKQVATTGSMQPGEESAVRTVELVVPDKRNPEQTRLEMRFAPSLVIAMLDALPYCIDYPYGCTEQTMSRFLPALLTLKTIRNIGVDLEDLRDIRGRMDETRRIEKGEHRQIWSAIDNPVFDRAEMDRIIAKCLARITDMQQGDGGWGWWKRGNSNGTMTCTVLNGLLEARGCDIKVDEGMIQRGLAFLKRDTENRMQKEYWSPHARHAFTAYVLSLAAERAAIEPGKGDDRPRDLIERLYTGRDRLSVYGKALLSLALANLDDNKRARTVLRNILQFKEENSETEVAWFRTSRQGWWYWWNSDIETNAWCLRALVRLDPRSETAPRLVKWLLNNRKNGYYWRSTRDTTLCVAAMSEFVAASGEGEPDYTLTLDFDNGAVVKSVKISRDNFFTCDNRFVLEGAALGSGKHTLVIRKEGRGALYFSTYLSYFTKEEDIKAAGLELKVDRSYFKLAQIPYEVDVEGSTGQAVKEKRLRYERVPIKTGDAIQSGDIIQVELKVTSDNHYTYLCFEDMKPAGCEPLELRSGGAGQEGFYSYMELRDEKVVFFVSNLDQGQHLLRYRLRAETPGIFHALPTTLYGMYVPELRANSDELVMKITE